MRRRAPLQKLRGSDPMMLEVQLQDLLLRPSSQLEPPNLCDLFALDEMEDAPKAVRNRVRGFIERAKGEMAEIADGSEMKTFVEELLAVEGTRVPGSMRAYLGELCAREGRDGTALRGLIDSLDGVEPEPFTLGAPTIRVQRAEAVKPESTKRTRRASGSARGTAKRTAAPKKEKVRKVVDIEREKWIRDTLIERLSGTGESGLGEHVLIAGLRHRAKPHYPNLGAHEVKAVLNDLLKKGLARKSAGRWSRG